MRHGRKDAAGVRGRADVRSAPWASVVARTIQSEPGLRALDESAQVFENGERPYSLRKRPRLTRAERRPLHSPAKTRTPARCSGGAYGTGQLMSCCVVLFLATVTDSLTGDGAPHAWTPS